MQRGYVHVLVQKVQAIAIVVTTVQYSHSAILLVTTVAFLALKAITHSSAQGFLAQKLQKGCVNHQDISGSKQSCARM